MIESDMFIGDVTRSETTLNLCEPSLRTRLAENRKLDVGGQFGGLEPSQSGSGIFSGSVIVHFNGKWATARYFYGLNTYSAILLQN
jgi:hypothetical protein